MIGFDRKPSPDLRAEIAALVVGGSMLPRPVRLHDPVHAVIAGHCSARAAFSAECNKEPDGCGDDRVKRLGDAEHPARRDLLSFVPRTLTGLEAKLVYRLAFSLPACREGDPGNEASLLLKATAEALTKLVGRAVACCGSVAWMCCNGPKLIVFA